MNNLTLKLVLCGILVLRVFLFNAAFPFWNNVDEQAHFDTVVKYARGYLPRAHANGYDPESIPLIVLHQSPEYLNNLDTLGWSEWPPPLWRAEPGQAQLAVREESGKWQEMKNHEAYSPPVYYAVAACWYDLGKMLGLQGIRLLYWLRFLNIPIYVALFWLAHLFCSRIFRGSPSMHTGTLLLLTFFPQDAFYSINSDVLSPLLALASLLVASTVYERGGSRPLYAATGIAFGATVLVKFSNIPMLAVFALFVLLLAGKAVKAGRLKDESVNLLLLTAACALPLVSWLAWNAHALGDVTGSSEKIRILGWTVKPLAGMLNHPIFGFDGFITFTSDLLKSFWRGEFVWENGPLASLGMDRLYVASSWLFVCASIANSFVAGDSYPPDQRLAIRASALTLVGYVCFLAALSTFYDFGSCVNPSQDHPYFTSGRLALGALVPFLLLYLDGLRTLAGIVSRKLDPVWAVLALCLVIAVSEAELTATVFKSSYNWFHL
jgi:4-amino-4-deoxy-L-arabinose transferase-like glycosyltransferase